MEKDVIKEVERNLFMPVFNYEYHSEWSYHMAISYINGQIFIKDSCKYPDWLSTVVVVKKKNGKWKVYIDFTNLNKACPKDNISLPKIDQLVDATVGFEIMSFLDVCSRYNRIEMNEGDMIHTAFVIERGI